MKVISSDPTKDANVVYDAHEVTQDGFTPSSNPANHEPPPPPLPVKKGQWVVRRKAHDGKREQDYVMVMSTKQFREKFRSVKEGSEPKDAKVAAGGK